MHLKQAGVPVLVDFPTLRMAYSLDLQLIRQIVPGTRGNTTLFRGNGVYGNVGIREERELDVTACLPQSRALDAHRDVKL